jgi:biopolymer transport protein ExbD/biopolymer transport protein TolR
MTESLPKKKKKNKRRAIQVQKVARLDPEINVTPLVDVVLVLLIIFMVMTPLAERDLGVYLSSEKRTKNSTEVAANQVVVSVQGNGGLEINSQPVAQAEYVSKLKGLLAGREPEESVVFVVAGDSADYPSLVGAIDRAKQAGASTVGLALDQNPTPAPSTAAPTPGPASPAVAPAPSP